MTLNAHLGDAERSPGICDDRGFDSVRCLLIELAQQRSVESVLQLAVRRLSELYDVALTRIWLTAAGDICSSCLLRDECPDQSRCLHLVASAGTSLAGDEVWDGIEGQFRRLPMGIRKVGQVAATGESVELSVLDSSASWIARPDWVKREQIRGLIGHPLDYRGEILGVIVVFLRESPPPDAMVWLRMVADHAASAIANSRAFEEIERLRSQLEMENDYLRDEVKAARSFGEVVGESHALRKVLEQVELVAPTDTTVLILGESGVGKELIARAIHEHSPRRERPLIRVNCASIPMELFESEFFGHVKGSFTGAVRDRLGRFELADGGTLFLDEVGEIPLDMQSKLLRVLQEGTFERIGEEQTRTANVRVVAATNRNLEAEVKHRRFREDLFYRLSVFPIEVVPLRERTEDIPFLAEHFLRLYGRDMGIPVSKLSRQQLLQLKNYDWPGNIRELQNVIQRAVIRSRGGPLQFDLAGNEKRFRSESLGPSIATDGSEREPLTEAEFRALERSNLLAALRRTGGKMSGPGGAAEYLGLHPATLASRMKKMGISRGSGDGVASSN